MNSKELPLIKDIEGQPADNTLMGIDLGNGYADYALCKGIWWSVNMDGGKIQEVRWQAREAEVQQIRAAIASRIRRGTR